MSKDQNETDAERIISAPCHKKILLFSLKRVNSPEFSSSCAHQFIGSYHRFDFLIHVQEALRVRRESGFVAVKTKQYSSLVHMKEKRDNVEVGGFFANCLYFSYVGWQVMLSLMELTLRELTSGWLFQLR